MRRAAILLAFVTASPVRSADAPAEPLVDQVRRSIQDGVAHLKQEQRGDGNWPVRRLESRGDGGAAALALLALLNAGQPVTDETVRRGLAYLRRVEPKDTYTVSLQTMVLVLAGEPADLKLIQRNVDWLQKARTPRGWSYTPGGGADNSNTQYALLALHEARLAGATVDPAVFREMRDLFIRTQDANGAWGYQPVKDDPPRLNMTTAGLCNLLMTGMDPEFSRQKLDPVTGRAENCGEYDENRPVAAALRRLSVSLPDRLTPENCKDVFGKNPFYGLYGLERAGRLSGRRFFGDHDWYRLGCRLLVETQRDGHWQHDGLDGDPVVATSFALLFLAKGRTPVLVTKLAHGGGNSLDWNRKRSDLRHLVDFCSRELFRRQPMAWQAFDVREKRAENQDAVRDLAAELLQSPIVFFNGHGLAPRDKEEAILREYVNNGGFILAEACCGSEDFDTDLRKLVERMFGKDALQKLPATHAVWRASGKFEVDPNEFPLWGVSQGCKTVLIYSPKPIAGYWEANDAGSKRGKVAFELGANIVAYATGLTPPRPRLTEMTVARDPPPDAGKRGFFRVAQLERTERAPAPRAMRNLMEEVRKAGLDVVPETRTFSPEADALKDYWFLYMHGREAFRYTDAEVTKLRFRLEHGATLLADACCGSKEFDESFRRMVEQMWPKKELKLEPIPRTDELFGRELNGDAINSVLCRRPGRPEFQVLPPELEGVKYRGRWVVIYSKYDLGCALEKAPSPGCIGHDYDNAVRLGRAAVLYALKR
jgi:hypothetical protein